MRKDAGSMGAGRLLAAVLLAPWAAVPALAEEPLAVTYGPAALTAEGDQDFRETIYLRVSDTVKDRLYLRVFDADTGGAHDLRYGTGWNTSVRYALVGGAGAASPPPAPTIGRNGRSAAPARR